MAPVDPTEFDDDQPLDAEGLFLSELWTHLDSAEELSIVPEALKNLDDVARHCEAAVALIRAWQADLAENATRPAS